MVTFWGKGILLGSIVGEFSLMCFVALLYGGSIVYLNVWIPDLYLLFYFETKLSSYLRSFKMVLGQSVSFTSHPFKINKSLVLQKT